MGFVAATGGEEESECSWISEAVVDGDVAREPPGILGIEGEPLDVLREAAVGCGSGAGSRDQIGREHCGRLIDVVGRVIRERVESLLIAGKCAAEDWLVNEINSKFDGVVSGCVAHVVTDLILLLIAERRK